MTSGISAALRSRVRAVAKDRCGYCLTRQEYVPLELEIEHIVPVSKGGSDDEENLWLACRTCNLYKSNQTSALDPVTGRRVRLFDPRRQQLSRHFVWSEDGVFIIGQSSCGRATVLALNLNNFVAVTVRRNWVKAGWHPPQD